MIEFLKVSPGSLEDSAKVWSVANRLRVGDKQEVWLSSGKSPKRCAFESFTHSKHTWVITVNGHPECLFGVGESHKPDVGVVWMLGTDEVPKHRKALLREARAWVEQMLDIYPTLYNLVHADNTVSIAWLKRLGFTLMLPMAHGPFGATFIPFFRTRNV